MTGVPDSQMTRSLPSVQFDGYGLSLDRREVLKPLSMSLPAGKLAGLLGPKGAGKSAILRSVVGAEGFMGRVTKQVGTIRVGGEPIPSGRAELQRFRRRVTLVPANAGPFPIPVFDNVVAALRGVVQSRDEQRERVVSCLQRIGLSEPRWKVSALELKHAERRFLGLARALALMPDVILIDEPFEGLDPHQNRRMGELLASLTGEHTVVFATQHVERAAAVASDLTLIVDGSLIESGDTLQMLGNPRDARTEAYFSGRPMPGYETGPLAE